MTFPKLLGDGQTASFIGRFGSADALGLARLYCPDSGVPPTPHPSGPPPARDSAANPRWDSRLQRCCRGSAVGTLGPAEGVDLKLYALVVSDQLSRGP